MEFRTPRKEKALTALPGSLKKEAISIPPSPFLKKIGHGTGITVYKMERMALPNKTQSPWALKKVAKNKNISSKIKTRLMDEAETLRKLNHPNIVGFRGVLKAHDGEQCLAMEQCNTSLGDLIEKRAEDGLDAFEPRQIFKMLKDVSNALNYLHNEALLLHSDIKSHNILIKGEFDICKLCDFGIALPLKPDGFVDTAKTGGILEYEGTELWAPCECLEEDPIITTKADIFSTGLVIWEMLALCPPHCNAFDNSLATNNSSILEDSFLQLAGTRPALPSQEFGPEYNPILEVFYYLTEEEFELRPTAKMLCECLNEIEIDFGLKASKA